MHLHSFRPQSPQLQSVVNGYVIWESPEASCMDKLIVPSLDCGFGLTLSGELSVQYDDTLQKTPRFGTRNIAIPTKKVVTSSHFFNISVRLRPGGIAKFAKSNLGDAYENNVIGLDRVFPERSIDILANQMHDTKTHVQKVAQLEQFLLSKIIVTHESILDRAIHLIYKTKGQIKINELAQTLSTTERQLQRIFLAATGMSPKHFSKVVRFRYLVDILTRQNKNTSSLTFSMLEAGYFDQAHGIKDFKAILGIVPKEFCSLQQNGLSDFYNFRQPD
jgi:AraC-like DNA-binding protein